MSRRRADGPGKGHGLIDMGRAPRVHADLAATVGMAPTCDLMAGIWQTIVATEARLEDAAAELHYLSLVCRELAERAGCAPVAPILADDLDPEAGTPRDPPGA